MAFAQNPIAGPQNLADGGQATAFRGDRTGAAVFWEGGGKWQEYTRLGQMYTYGTPAAGVAIPLYSSTTQQCVLFNPVNNTKAFVIKSITFGYVSGTQVAGHYCLAVQTLATNAVSGTASAIVTNHKLTGAGVGPAGSLTLYTAATVVAFTYFRALALSQVVQAATATNAPWVFTEELDGSVVLLPGAALAVAANQAAFSTNTVAITGAEIPAALVS